MATIDSSARSPAVAAPVPVQVPVPGPTPTPPDRALQTTLAAHPFAELLQQQKTMSSATPAAAIAEPRGATPAAAVAAASADDAGPQSTVLQRDAAQAKARLAAAPHQASRSAGTKAPPADTASDRMKAHDKGADAGANGTAKDACALPAADAAAVAATLAQAAPGATRASKVQAGRLLADARTTATLAGDVAAQAAAAQVSTSTEAPAATAAGAAGDRRGSRVDFGAAIAATDVRTERALDATPKSSFGAPLTESNNAHVAAPAPERLAADAASLAALQGGAAPQPAAGAATAVASAAVPTPVDAPDFAAAFGMQVSVLTKGGVQRAELHLNPADMGPVSIHITLDGKLAHIDFGADIAATRHAIEAGLPELASALQDAGFTLAGGGVAQHSASKGGGQGDTPPGRTAMASAGKATIGAIDAAAQRQTRRVVAGGVDVFA